jgi:hypothetical protein
MRVCPNTVVWAIAAIALAGPALADTISFAGAESYGLPKDFVAAPTGNSPAGRWAIVDDASAEGGRALASLHRDAAGDGRSTLAIYMPTIQSDVEARVRFKPASGSLNQVAGLAVRLQTAQSYYLAAADARANSVRFYCVKAGSVDEIGSADIRVAAEQWHTLSVRALGDRFLVSLDDSRLIDAHDETFPSPGKVALWTDADSGTRFDRMEVAPLDDTAARP